MKYSHAPHNCVSQQQKTRTEWWSLTERIDYTIEPKCAVVYTTEICVSTLYDVPKIKSPNDTFLRR